MRILAFCCTLMVAAASPAQHKKSETRYTLGYAYRDGSIDPVLSLERDRRITAGIGFVFALVHGKRVRLYGETTALGGFRGLQSHALRIDSQIARIGPLRVDGGVAFEYNEQPASIFAHERTDIRSNRRYGTVMASLLTGVGSYRGTYARGGIVTGVGYIEHTLDLYIDDEHIRNNRSEVASGTPRLYGLRFQAGTHLRGLRLEGGATQLLVNGVSANVLDSQQVIEGSVSYQTPWFVGFYVRGARSTGAINHLFLENSMTFGGTFHWPK